LITTSSYASEVFAYDSGFGHSTIANFVASGSSHDVLQVQSAMFSNVASLLGAAQQSGANVTITDPAGDTITLNNVTVATLVANPGDFKVV
jgi:serralysin